jgi:uncharacterized DUF497 family protein
MATKRRPVFVRNEWNLAHIAEHDVTSQEAEEVFNAAKPPYPRKVNDDKYLVHGSTAEGRYLQVIFIYPQDEDVDVADLDPMDRLLFMEDKARAVYIIHARELTRRQKSKFRRRRGT